MPSVKRIETTSSDGKVALRTEKDGQVSVIDAVADADGEDAVCVSEDSLLEAVLEYAHERGLRRTRKVKASGNGVVKRRRVAKAEAVAPVLDA